LTRVKAADEWRAGRADLLHDPEAVKKRQRLRMNEVRREGVAWKGGLLHHRNAHPATGKQRRQRRPRAARADDHAVIAFHQSPVDGSMTVETLEMGSGGRPPQRGGGTG